MEIFTERDTFVAAIEKVKRNTEDIDFSQGVVTYVDVHFSEYRKKVDTKTVRRNVALPSWLNYEAEHAGINVSRVLQEALTLSVSLFRKDSVLTRLLNIAGYSFLL